MLRQRLQIYLYHFPEGIEKRAQWVAAVSRKNCMLTAATQKRRIENSNRLTAAESLLYLSTVGNGTEYCEPGIGTSAMTDLLMADLVEMEEDWQKLLH